MNKIITLSIATIFLATSYASHSQNIEHQSPHHKIHWGYKGVIVCLVSLMLVAARKTLSNFILDCVVFISFSLIIIT
jgi:hypothetical protein